jgi:hypothetical protein
MTTRNTRPPLTVDDLALEIEQTLLGTRDQIRRQSLDEHGQPRVPVACDRYECSVVLDITLALLIRHRLPIDARRTELAVRRGQRESHTPRRWAKACAEHILQVADERTHAVDQTV